MALTLTYDTTLSRVRIVADGLGDADTATVERSTNEITWTVIRGGIDAPVSGGVCAVDDYEFVANQPNYYRVTTLRDITHVGTGAAVQANNVAVNPALPAGILDGDALFLVAAHHGANAFANTPAGWTLLRDLNTLRLFGKLAEPGETAPNVTWSNGTAGPCGAQIAAWRNATLDTEGNGLFSISPVVNISYSGISPDVAHSLILYIGWKRANWTSVDVLPPNGGGVPAEVGEFTTLLSSIGQGVVWDWMVQPTPTSVAIPGGHFTVNGGPTAIARGMLAVAPPTTFVQSGQITPTLNQIWLKFPAKPFLNRAIAVIDYTDPERAGRVGLFPVMGRTLPIARTDLMTGRQMTLTVRTPTLDAGRDLDLAVSSGDIIFLHTPPTCEIPTMYAAVASTALRRPRRAPNVGPRYVELPLSEVAAPAPDIVGATITWQGVLNRYATWADVITANPTWQDLLDNVGDSSDIPVP